MIKAKPLVVSVLGAPRSGKSCLVGALMGNEEYMSNYLKENIEKEMPTVHPSLNVVQNLTEEDIPTDLYLHDLPSIPKYIKTIYIQLAISDACLLTVPAKGFKLQADSLRYLSVLAFVAGIQQIIIVITKMELVDFLESKFDEACAHTYNLLYNIGFKKEHIKTCIPTSKTQKDIFTNILQKNDVAQLDWWDGDFLFNEIKKLKVPLSQSENLAEFRFVVTKSINSQLITKKLKLFGRVLYGNLAERNNSSSLHLCNGKKVVVSPPYKDPFRYVFYKQLATGMYLQIQPYSTAQYINRSAKTRGISAYRRYFLSSEPNTSDVTSGNLTGKTFLPESEKEPIFCDLFVN